MFADQTRADYVKRGLARSDLDADPIQQFREWYELAVECSPGDWFEIASMTLATADAAGRVSARVILFKGIDESGLLFFTNYESEKGRQIASNSRAALVFFWPQLARQVRVEGQVTKTNAATSDAYFASRPHGSQVSAVVSAQSRVIASRELLEDAAAELESRYERSGIPRPQTWGGYRLEPDWFEFWQGRENRLHDRFRYRRNNDVWVIERLCP